MIIITITMIIITMIIVNRLNRLLNFYRQL